MLRRRQDDAVTVDFALVRGLVRHRKCSLIAFNLIGKSLMDSKWWNGRAFALRLTVAAGLMFHAGTASAKIGFEFFSQDQQQIFWKLLDTFAAYEALVRVCGHKTGFEQKMIAATKDCVKPDAISRARSAFRHKISAYIRKAAPGICELQSTKDLVAKIRRAMESTAEQSAQACRACWFC